MRSNPKLVSLGTYLAILLFNAYALGLYANGQLTLYIHPRYVLFTAVLNAVSLLICGAGFVLAARQPGIPGVHVSWRPSFTLVVAAMVLVAAYALPARTLSSGTADQRSDNLNGSEAPRLEGSPGGTLALFGADTERLTIPDWVSAFNGETDPDFYEGKKVDVVGFVFHPRGAPEDVFYVSRFRVTCCAVDAQPLGMPVHSPGWKDEFEADDWVRVTGGFADSNGEVSEPVFVDPKDIQRVEQPEDPYVT